LSFSIVVVVTVRASDCTAAMEGASRGEEFDGGARRRPIANDEPIAKTAEQIAGAQVVGE
jgi:hypothetical protein